MVSIVSQFQQGPPLLCPAADMGATVTPAQVRDTDAFLDLVWCRYGWCLAFPLELFAFSLLCCFCFVFVAVVLLLFVQVDIIEDLVNDAVLHGAKVRCGGKRNTALAPGLFFQVRAHVCSYSPIPSRMLPVTRPVLRMDLVRSECRFVPCCPRPPIFSANRSRPFLPM